MNDNDKEKLRIKIEEKKLNKQLDNELKDIIKKGESLRNYEVWINSKTNIIVSTSYIIDIKIKDFQKEGITVLPYNVDKVVYIIIKK